MATYTIAYTVSQENVDSLILAIVRDGENIETAVNEAVASINIYNEDGSVPKWDYESGLLLTDKEPDDIQKIVWSGYSCGGIIDENDRVYRYAIRP